VVEEEEEKEHEEEHEEEEEHEGEEQEEVLYKASLLLSVPLHPQTSRLSDPPIFHNQ